MSKSTSDDRNGWAEPPEFIASNGHCSGFERDLERERQAAQDAQIDGEGTSAGNGAPVDDTTPAAKPLEVLIEERKFNPALNPPPIRPVYSINGTPICTRGNTTVIVAPVKVGKTAALGAMQASALKPDGAHCDTFGFTSSNPDGLALIVLDTEQSKDDHWHAANRAMRRATLRDLPPWFLSYCLTGFDAPKAQAALWLVMQSAAEKFGGIHSVLIDGYADLVRDVNDAAESNAFVARLHDSAIRFDCPIAGVLHFNPGGEKSRGHLGSQLERKSETNLRLDKDGIYTELWSDKQRRAPILKGTGPRFRWDDEAGMHISVESSQEARFDSKTEAARNYVEDVFKDRPSMRYCDLETTVQTLLKCQPRWAGKKISEWEKLGVIKKSIAGLWIPKV